MRSASSSGSLTSAGDLLVLVRSGQRVPPCAQRRDHRGTGPDLLDRIALAPADPDLHAGRVLTDLREQRGLADTGRARRSARWHWFRAGRNHATPTAHWPSARYDLATVLTARHHLKETAFLLARVTGAAPPRIARSGDVQCGASAATLVSSTRDLTLNLETVAKVGAYECGDTNRYLAIS